jgi:uridine phosphorylase
MAGENEVLKHIRCRKGDIAPYVIIPGDPGRVERIVAEMDDAKHLAKNREYVVYTGTYRNVPMTVCSSGIGGPAASIAFEELIKLGAKVFIRVGSAGGRRPDTPIGTPIVINATYRGEGTSKAYLPPEFPAVSDLDVTNALVRALKNLKEPYQVGLGFTRDAYYVQDRELKPAPHRLRSSGGGARSGNPVYLRLCTGSQDRSDCLHRLEYLVGKAAVTCRKKKNFSLKASGLRFTPP